MRANLQNKGGDTGVDADEDVDAGKNDVSRAGYLQWNASKLQVTSRYLKYWKELIGLVASLLWFGIEAATNRFQLRAKRRVSKQLNTKRACISYLGGAKF